jgi:aspartate carbamoyltransferase catalytic subunit
MKHLFDIKELTANDIMGLIEQTNQFRGADINATQKLHKGRSAMALFFENSTRTLTSFQLACQRLGIDVVALNIAHSSTQKGETIKDTVLTLDAMQTDLFIVRHQENHIQQQMASWLNDSTSIINAGDGTNQHPTQGLLDLYTIYQHKNNFSQLKVAIIGDIKHSRVANSLVDGLQTMNVNEISLFAPDTMIPTAQKHLLAIDINSCVKDADVVVMLRIQKERLPEDLEVNFAQWHEYYGLNSERLLLAKPDAIVMHPGPMNRGIEITDEVADGPQSVILNQVQNGVLMRQALIHRLLS